MTSMRQISLPLLASVLFFGAPPLRAQAPAPPALAKGDTVPPFEAEGIDGASRRIEYPKDSATVLMFFLSSCPTCHRMIPLWNSAYERRPRELRVFAVLLDQEPPGFFMATPVLFPVLRAPGRTPAERKAFSDSFRLHRVPLTLRVGPGGNVEDVAQGPVDAIRLGELFRPQRAVSEARPR
jgi:hypothetical protein